MGYNDNNATIFALMEICRIVPMLTEGSGVITTRNDVHYIATEFGVADLYGRPIRDRVRALIDIAHPDFRAELAEQASELYVVRQWIGIHLAGTDGSDNAEIQQQ